MLLNLSKDVVEDCKLLADVSAEGGRRPPHTQLYPQPCYPIHSIAQQPTQLLLPFLLCGSPVLAVLAGNGAHHAGLVASVREAHTQSCQSAALPIPPTPFVTSLLRASLRLCPRVVQSRSVWRRPR